MNICMSYDQKKGQESKWEFPFNRKPFENKGNDWGMPYTVERIFLKAIRYCPCMLQIVLIWRRNKHSKFWDNKNPNLWLSFGRPKKKHYLDVAPMKSTKYTIRKEWWLLPKVTNCVKLDVVPTKFTTPFVSNLH